MQSIVPRAIGMIEFGTEGDNSTVARYKITKMMLALLGGLPYQVDRVTLPFM